ncbi:MAG: hypothetical protein IJG84_11440 [Kiritimatiellae bacterium]|nr:hypothetical protein [Kiritimatiellia bacterium]
MSGGCMEYAYSRIYQAAMDVKEYLYEAEKSHPSDYEFDSGRLHMSPEDLRKKVIQYMMNAYVALRVAEVYAKRVEWLKSGDDGYDNFIERTDKDLAELDMMLNFTVKKPTEYEVNDMRECLVQLMDAVERCGYREFEEVDDDSPMYKAWNRAKELIGGKGD